MKAILPRQMLLALLLSVLPLPLASCGENNEDAALKGIDKRGNVDPSALTPAPEGTKTETPKGYPKAAR
jgi:hypothetical protein